MSAPRVYRAINAVAAELALKGIAKSNIHLGEGYQYRSIDDVLNRLSPLLAKHRLCVLPRALERDRIGQGPDGGPQLSLVALKVAYDFVCVQDASVHTVEIFGEALDEGDKATMKAMSSAYKTAMLQTFCIPIEGLEDVDASAIRLSKADHEPAPLQGWDQWSEDMKEMIATCVSTAALERVQNRYRSQLKSISRERPELYRSIGAAFLSAASVAAKAGPPQITSNEDFLQSTAPGMQVREVAVTGVVGVGRVCRAVFPATARSRVIAAVQRTGLGFEDISARCLDVTYYPSNVPTSAKGRTGARRSSLLING